MAREDITAEKAEVDDGPNNGEESTRRSSSLWRKVCDMEEAKNQLLFSLPMILTNLSYYAITRVSVMFAGHLGQLQLAGATFANSWAFVTGFSLMVNSPISSPTQSNLKHIWTDILFVFSDGFKWSA